MRFQQFEGGGTTRKTVVDKKECQKLSKHMVMWGNLLNARG